MSEHYKAIVRIRIIGESDETERSFGIGTAQLLRGVKEMASLNKAAKAMGMAYSKAWKSINTTEEHLGYHLIDRNGPKGSALTQEGEEFLEMYDKMCIAAQEAVQGVLDEYSKA